MIHPNNCCEPLYSRAVVWMTAMLLRKFTFYLQRPWYVSKIVSLPGTSSWIDFTNPEIRKWWAGKFALNEYQVWFGSDRFLVWSVLQFYQKLTSGLRHVTCSHSVWIFTYCYVPYMLTIAPDLRSFPGAACSLRALSQCSSHLIGFFIVIHFPNLLIKLNVRTLSAEEICEFPIGFHPWGGPHNLSLSSYLLHEFKLVYFYLSK